MVRFSHHKELVQDPIDWVNDDFPGWTGEGNIYWDNDYWREMEHGAEDIGFKEGDRRLFWVRLQLREHDKSIFLSTAHFTAQTHHEEIDSGVSPRLHYTRKSIEQLTRLVNQNEAAFLMGDLNDPVLPTRLLHGAGFISCFSALGLQPPPTWKCYPTANVNAGTPVISETIDWILANPRARALAALVPKCFYGDMAPSDHWPVQAVYEV